MFSRLVTISKSNWYWIVLVIAGIAFEAVALYYQYVLDYGPCVLCIHVRILVLVFIIVGLLVLFIRKPTIHKVGHLLNVGVFAWMAERSWVTLGTERGTIFASCGMDLGLPSWFALDQWFPTVFEVWESCGYTPELLFGITMAEALVVFSIFMFAVSVTLFIASLFKVKKRAHSEFTLFR